jgi:hypothetical protein
MAYDYASIKSVNEEEFDRWRVDPDVLERDYLRADEADVTRIERFLDLDEGTLKDRGPYFLKISDCRTCAQPLRVSDFVITAMLDASHPRSFIAAVLLGDKKVVQKPRKVRCSSCGTLSLDEAQYWMNDYACADPPPPPSS